MGENERVAVGQASLAAKLAGANCMKTHTINVVLLGLILGVCLGSLISQQYRTVQAQSQYAITTPARVTGDAATHKLATTGTARWVLVVAEAGNTDPVRCGDSNVSATRGIPIYATSTAGGGVMLPPATVSQTFMALNNVYCYASTGDKFSWAWGN